MLGKAPHEWTDTLLVLRQRPRDRLLRYQSANLDEDIEILRQYFLEYDVGVSNSNSAIGPDTNERIALCRAEEGECLPSELIDSITTRHQ